MHIGVYRNVCYINFRADLQIPRILTKFTSRKHVLDDQKIKKSLARFQHVIQYLESMENEQVTITDLVKLMERNLITSLMERNLITSEEDGSRTSESAYSVLYTKKKRRDHYNYGIVISQEKGRYAESNSKCHPA